MSAAGLAPKVGPLGLVRGVVPLLRTGCIDPMMSVMTAFTPGQPPRAIAMEVQKRCRGWENYKIDTRVLLYPGTPESTLECSWRGDGDELLMRHLWWSLCVRGCALHG